MIKDVLFTILQDVVFCGLLFLGAILFAKIFYRAYKGEAIWHKSHNKYGGIELFIYKIMRIDYNENMGVKKYTSTLLIFSLINFVGLYLILLLQNLFLFNPEGYAGMSWDLAYNTAASFVSNTNWQAYFGETTLGYFAQMMGLTVQNFVSGAVGIAVLFALIRGFTNKESRLLGNFLVDVTKIIIYAMLPICFVFALILVSEGVPQTFGGSIDYVSLNGLANKIYLGPSASQIAIKQIFTNGGGFWGTNSAYL